MEAGSLSLIESAAEKWETVMEHEYNRSPEGGQMDALEKIFSNPKKSWMNLLLIGMNVVLFLIAEVMGDTLNSGFAVDWGASYTPLIQAGEYWRLFTSMFYHFGFQHLFNNMVLLLFLGDVLESQLGHWKYLLLYLAGGLGGNLLSLYLDIRSGEALISAGASGCVFAVVGALLYILIRRKGRLEEMTVQRLALMAILSIYYGFTSVQVDNAAHIGGLISGFLLAVLLFRQRKPGR